MSNDVSVVTGDAKKVVECRNTVYFDDLLLKVRRAETKLASWDKALRDPKKFKLVIKCEWDRAFDLRERLKTQLCKMDRVRYAEIYPNEPNDRG
jgi:hypothetical protein